MNYLVTLYQDEDGMWVVECPAVPGCLSQGKTREEAVANIKEAISVCLKVRAEEGMPPLEIETHEVQVTV
jgi:predicted RNase H-like HicB family nuclease